MGSERECEAGDDHEHRGLGEPAHEGDRRKQRESPSMALGRAEDEFERRLRARRVARLGIRISSTAHAEASVGACLRPSAHSPVRGAHREMPELPDGLQPLGAAADFDAPLLSNLADRTFGRGGLRVLAYHGVDDVDGFTRQMHRVAADYEPVRATQVVAAFAGSAALPPRAVWVTFDDGLPSVVHDGQPILDELGIEGTLFVCPGLIESGAPNWWDVVEAAFSTGTARPAGLEGRTVGEATTYLKSVPDTERRELVDELADALRAAVAFPPSTQLDDSDLEAWTAAGHVLGNHSWDHPCLDRCTPDEQRRQIEIADAWLRERVADGPRLFAYPNGNATPTVEETVATLGYDLALLFDHRLARVDAGAMHVSRLRAPPPRAATASPRS